MKITLSQPALYSAIVRGGVAAPKNPHLPILSHVRLIADMIGLNVASNDLDRFAECTVDAQVAEAGSCCVSAQAFATLIGKHPESGTVALELEGDRLLVTCGRSKVRLPILPAKDFPAWADEAPISSFSLPAPEFERALTSVRYAASADATMPFCQGIWLDVREDGLRFVATDTHRLAKWTIPAPDGAATCPRVTVPIEAVDAALRVFVGVAEIAVRVNGSAISFAAGGLRLSSRLIETNWPDYDRIIPARGMPAIRFDRADFVDSLDRANVLVGDGEFSGITAVPADGSLILRSANQKGGDAFEEFAAEVDSAVQSFGFNSKYASQFLSPLKVKAITIEQSGPMDGHLLYSDDEPRFTGLLMPMKALAA